MTNKFINTRITCLNYNREIFIFSIRFFLKIDIGPYFLFKLLQYFFQVTPIQKINYNFYGGLFCAHRTRRRKINQIVRHHIKFQNTTFLSVYMRIKMWVEQFSGLDFSM